jgi:hypothetical protein
LAKPIAKPPMYLDRSLAKLIKRFFQKVSEHFFRRPR